MRTRYTDNVYIFHYFDTQNLFKFNPLYEFTSERSGLTVELTDSYLARNEMLSQLYRNANNWFSIALVRAPVEFQAILQVNSPFSAFLLGFILIRNT